MCIVVAVVVTCVNWVCAVGTMPSVPVGLSYHEMFAVSLGSPALWRCRACGKQVTNRWHHFHIHTAQRSLCPYCPATYSRIDTLRSHIRSKHRELLFAKGSLQTMGFPGRRRRRMQIVRPIFNQRNKPLRCVNLLQSHPRSVKKRR